MKTATYTKINTLYKRFINLSKVELPNKAWRAFQNKIIPGDFSEEHTAFIKGLQFDCFSKIDGTNAKIVYLPSTGKCFCGGKSDNSDITGNGLKSFLDKVIERIRPVLAEMFPPETARFTPVLDDRKRIKLYHMPGHEDVLSEDLHPEEMHTGDLRTVVMEEAPVYIYGEYFGRKVQDGGNYDRDGNRFNVFDICQQGWYVPVDLLRAYCERLGLEMVPYIGRMDLAEAERRVVYGFRTLVPNASNPDYEEEGIVARPAVPIKDPRGNRIIVKIKTCDYRDLDRAIKQVGQDEYHKFLAWYMDNRNLIEKQ